MKNNYEEEIEKLRKQKLLYQLKDEINNLEKEIKYQKIKNFKTGIIRNTKISAYTINAIAPYTITLLLATGIFKAATGGYPFICDSVTKIPATITKEIDSNGDIKEEKKYTHQDEESDEIYLYTKWKYDEKEATYKRNVEWYEIYNLSEEQVEELIQLDEETLKLIFGNPDYYETERNDQINETEKNNNEYIKIITHTENPNDYILKKESLLTNIIATIVYLYGLTIGEFLALIYKTLRQKNDPRLKIDKIKMQYPYIDKDIYLKKLELKKENYNRLTRK